MSVPIRVLFVCLGNICRSPMAKAILENLLLKRDLQDRILVDSVGIGHWHVGKTVHEGTLEVLKQHHIPINHTVRQIDYQADLAQADYILGMDERNLATLKNNQIDGMKGKLCLFLSYAYDANLVLDTIVPDPYKTGEFQKTYELISIGCLALLDNIVKENGFC